VARDDHTQLEAHAEHNKSVFVIRVIWIKELNGMLIKKHRLCLIERNTVLPSIRLFLYSIPFKTHGVMYTVRMRYGLVKPTLWRSCWQGEFSRSDSFTCPLIDRISGEAWQITRVIHPLQPQAERAGSHEAADLPD
jgi:hypothetical protein